MAAEHRATAIWEGDLMTGSGRYSLATGAAQDAPITWKARTEGGGTSPEELIAAAHAGCVSMALANTLAKAGTPPGRLRTDATATFDKTDDGFRLTTMRLAIRGEVEGVDEAGFREAAEDAKANCPVSKALEGNVEVSIDAALATPAPA